MIKPILYDYFEKKANSLWSDYQVSKTQSASRNIGDNREEFINRFLKKCLPPKLKVDSGEILDKKGNKTGQIDTIIIRDDCPSLDIGQNNTFLAEGVFAIIEVKSNLNNEKLIEAGNKLIEIKNLEIDFGIGIRSGAKCDRPLRMVFAYEGATLPTIKNTLMNNNWLDIFDLICILNRGVIINSGEDEKVERVFEDKEDESQLLLASGRAAALGFIYYFLINYGVTFLARSFNIHKYFEPIQYWDKDS